MKTLVTGGLGFIGSEYVRSATESVRIIARPSSRRWLGRIDTVSNPDIHWVDIARDDLADALGDITTVMHYAAKTFVDRSITDAAPFVESNIVGSYRLLEAIRRSPTIEKVWWQSTDEVYGAILTGAYTEESRLNPTNPYAATKAGADGLAMAYHNTYGIPIVIGRAENVYGPFQGPEKVLPTFVRSVLRGEPIPVYGDGLHVRQWIHVKDAIGAARFLMQHGTNGEVYHVAGAQELTNIALAEIVLGALKGAHGYKLIDDRNIRAGHDRRYALSTVKVNALGWYPQIKLADGMRSVMEWYRDNPQWTGV